MEKNKNSKQVYPPAMRNFASYDSKQVCSYGKKTFINIPALGCDPIVSNNIVTAEFDYTDSLADQDSTK
ncbi:MAG: hypothetical protein ACRCX8_10405 [Sarcina sp.]